MRPFNGAFGEDEEEEGEEAKCEIAITSVSHLCASIYAPQYVSMLMMAISGRSIGRRKYDG